MSIKKMLEMSVYNEENQTWEAGAPKTVAAAVETEDGTTVQAELNAAKDSLGSIHALLESDDETLDTLQEVVDYVKENRENLGLLGTQNAQAIGELNTALESVDAKFADYATTNAVASAVAGALPYISDTPPTNPVAGQVWFKPVEFAD